MCFCALLAAGGGIRGHMTETPDVFTPSQFDQASPSPDFVALLEDINTTQPARTSVHCLSIVQSYAVLLLLCTVWIEFGTRHAYSHYGALTDKGRT